MKKTLRMVFGVLALFTAFGAAPTFADICLVPHSDNSCDELAYILSQTDGKCSSKGICCDLAADAAFWMEVNNCNREMN